jgi:hypothetical protein
MLAEEVGFGFFLEGGFEHAGAGAAQRLGVGERESLGLAADVLVNRQQSGCAAAFGEDFADAVAGRFGRDHGDINVARRLDSLEVDVESVGEHERLAAREVRRDGGGIERGLAGVGGDDHDDVGPGGSAVGGDGIEAMLLGAGARAAGFRKAHLHGDAAVAQVEGVGVPLRAVAEDGDLLAADEGEVGGVVVVDLCHCNSPNKSCESRVPSKSRFLAALGMTTDY